MNHEPDEGSLRSPISQEEEFRPAAFGESSREEILPVRNGIRASDTDMDRDNDDESSGGVSSSYET